MDAGAEGSRGLSGCMGAPPSVRWCLIHVLMVGA